MISLGAIFCCLLVLFCLLSLLVSIARGLAVGASCRSALAPWFMAAGAACLAILLLRPHQDVFQGLDSSAYRLMAKAFGQGRHSENVDSALAEVPPDLRHWLLLRSDGVDRATRDRSFEIMSLDTCSTRPFFYPFLPLCAMGLDLLIPGNFLDFFVPCVGLILCLALLVVGVAFGGITGGSLVLVLFVGTPLSAWLLRGWYAESPAAVLLAMGVLAWIVRGLRSENAPAPAFLALGLAISFHPVMVVFAVPAAGIMLMSERGSPARIFPSIAAVIVGVLPFVLATLFVTAPYFGLTASGALEGIANSASLRSTVVVAAALGALIVAGLFRRRQIATAIASFHERHGKPVSMALVVLCVLPTLLAIKLWSDGAAVSRGLGELCDGLGLPLGVVLILLCLHALFAKSAPRAKVALTAMFLCLPVFLYLKGAEQMGLWSQRRLIAPLLVTIACCLPSAAALACAAVRPGAWRWARVAAAIFVLCFVGLYNAVPLAFVRHIWPDAPRKLLEHGWPAPYLVRYEQGADKWVDRMIERIGNRFAVADCYGYSVPLGVNGKSRVVGLSEQKGGFDGLGPVAEWLAEKAKKEDILWITAFGNPGLEDGVILEQEGERETATLYRARAKTALPAVKEKIVIDAALLRACAIKDGASPVMDKIFDGGILGLRPPWGRSDIPIKTAAGNLPAQWSREGSGIVGPVPRPGGAVRIAVVAVTGRTNLVQTQTLMIQPPWDGKALSLTIGSSLTETSGLLTRPAGQPDNDARTGIYRIRSGSPYDPLKEGIRKFDADLGALIHRIRIEPMNGTETIE